MAQIIPFRGKANAQQGRTSAPVQSTASDLFLSFFMLGIAAVRIAYDAGIQRAAKQWGRG